MRPHQKVLDGVSLTIPAGTVCALVGRSGGGKSTSARLSPHRVLSAFISNIFAPPPPSPLFLKSPPPVCHLLLRLYDPSSGAITIDGIDLRQLDLRWVHRSTGVVAQDTQLFANSIADNISYGLHRFGLFYAFFLFSHT